MARTSDQPNDYERITDAIAAETLVPASTFDLRWNEFTDIDTNLKALSAHYRVSVFVILRRAYDLEKIRYDTFHSEYTELSERTRSKKKSEGGGGYSAVFSRNSRTVTTALMFSVLEGRMSPKEASALLNIRIAKLPALTKYLHERIHA